MANFDNVKVGDKVAVHKRSNFWRSSGPVVSFSVFTVTRVMNTQFCIGSHNVRKSDGQIIGDKFRNVIHVDARFLAEHEAQVAAHNAYQKAYARLGPLRNAFDKLTTEQMVALADAFEKVAA